MLQNELLSRISSSIYNEKKPNVNISLSKEELDVLTKKYNTNENEILSVIDVFSNININSALIILPDGKLSSIDRNGNIKINNNLKSEEKFLDTK